MTTSPITTKRARSLSGVGSKPEVGVFRPTSDDLGRRAGTFDGLGFQTAWLWAGVTGTDGRRYALLRQHENASTHLYYGLEIAPDIWSDPTLRKANIPGFDDLYVGAISYEPEGEAHRITPFNPLYPPGTVEFQPDCYRWVESDWLDLTMTPLGSAMRYRCPGPPDDFGYTSQICRIEGTVDGQAVQGHGGLDRYYGEHGVGWSQSKGFQLLEEMWWVWAGEHDDGRQEHGVAIIGPGEFQVGFFERDGEEPVAVNELAVEIDWDEQGTKKLPVGATLHFGGRTFRYTASGNVTIPGADIFINWMHGEMCEDGAPVPAQRFSWLEYFKHLRAA
jgi:hypothetical protein